MRNWERPMVVVDTFAANEFVSTCGELNRVYKFKCDAGGGTPGTVYEDSNHSGKWDFGDKPLTGLILPTFHACSETHSAPTDDEFIEGFYLPNSDPFKATKVIIWTDGGTNVHCTTNLSKDSWETEKS